jgi:hypothetical protein
MSKKSEELKLINNEYYKYLSNTLEILKRDNANRSVEIDDEFIIMDNLLLDVDKDDTKSVNDFAFYMDDKIEELKLIYSK